MDEVFGLIEKEAVRQKNCINLIASENFASEAVLKATGSVLTNKYAEGYPGRRYYAGCVYIDEVENLARQRLKTIFNAQHVNVQPHSGASANLAVYFALIKPGDKIMGMSLSSGGHLTHGSHVSLSGKWFQPVSYDVDPESYLLNYDIIYDLAIKEKPQIIIAGGSAYPRKIDFQKFREIADAANAYLMVDMAHFSGLVAGGMFPNPLPYADVVTSTTHKTLRGPRGGIILTNNLDLGKKIDQAVMPGTQGGPLMHVIAAKAVAFQEILQDSYKDYIKQVVLNAEVLSKSLQNHGFNVLTGGTDTHLMLIDIRNIVENGAVAEKILEDLGIIINKNGIPFDPAPPLKPSGIRLGVPAMTTRGFKEKEFEKVADLINRALRGTTENIREEIETLLASCA